MGQIVKEAVSAAVADNKGSTREGDSPSDTSSHCLKPRVRRAASQLFLSCARRGTRGTNKERPAVRHPGSGQETGECFFPVLSSSPAMTKLEFFLRAHLGKRRELEFSFLISRACPPCHSAESPPWFLENEVDFRGGGNI